MEIDFDIHGLDGVEEALKKLGAETGAKELRGALRDAAKPILEEMVDRAPLFDDIERIVYLKPSKTKKSKKKLIAHGRLKETIKRRGKINKTGVASRRFDKNTTAVVSVGPKVFYAHMIEFGTKNIRAQPFIRPAAENKSQVAVKIFELRIQKRIKNAEKRMARKNRNK